MRKYLGLWTWLLSWLCRRFYHDGHPWKERERWFTLQEWYDRRTELLAEFNIMFWMFALLVFVAVVSSVLGLFHVSG